MASGLSGVEVVGGSGLRLDWEVETQSRNNCFFFFGGGDG